MEGMEWILNPLFLDMLRSAGSLFLAAALITLAFQMRLWQRHILFLQSYLVRARAADLNLLMHILADRLERSDPSSRAAKIISDQMDALADEMANHTLKTRDGGGRGKKPH